MRPEKLIHAMPWGWLKLLSPPILFLCLLGQVAAQTPATAVITGVVKDKLGKPLEGVTIELVGTKRGSSTDTTGKFSISIDNAKQQLRFSHVGYNTLLTSINNNLFLDITLDAAAGSMNEVVVVGYGQQKKISLVGAQSSVNIDDLKEPVANLSATLAAGRYPLRPGRRTAGPGLRARNSNRFSGSGVSLLLTRAATAQALLSSWTGYRAGVSMPSIPKTLPRLPY